MRTRLSGLILLIFLLVIGISATAQDDTPPESPAENACYEGGSLAGKCNWPTEAEIEWAWTCGWYIARAETGQIADSDVPSWCGYLQRADTCFTVNSQLLSDLADLEDIEDMEDFIAGVPDLKLIGALGTPNNAQILDSFDWSCSGALAMDVTLIGGPLLDITGYDDLANAEALTEMFDTCSQLLGRPSLGLPIGIFYNTPMNWWACIDIDDGGCGCPDDLVTTRKKEDVL